MKNMHGKTQILFCSLRSIIPLSQGRNGIYSFNTQSIDWGQYNNNHIN